MIQIAMLGKLTHTAMADAIFAHALLAEGLNTLFATFRHLGRCRTSHRVGKAGESGSGTAI